MGIGESGGAERTEDKSPLYRQDQLFSFLVGYPPCRLLRQALNQASDTRINP